MDKFVTILFAFRDRDLLRVQNSLDSLEKQTNKLFQVVFVDYGSRKVVSDQLKTLLEKYTFVNYFKVGHEGLLWNKSKAFNFGIRQSKTEYIFTGDIDLIFAPEMVDKLYRIRQTGGFSLFNYGYLKKDISVSSFQKTPFKEFKPSHYGDINGAGLYPKKALEEISGFDEFYHFYGSEDEDLFLRLRNSGLNEYREQENLLLHQWHKRYPDTHDKQLTVAPRIFNIRRINQQHFFHAQKTNRSVAREQEKWGLCFFPEDIDQLSLADHNYELGNKASEIVHFLNEVLPSLKGIVAMNFRLHQIYKTPRYYYRKFRGRSFEPYLSLKDINDEILKQIIFRYRHYNYIFKIEEDMNCVKFIIKL